MPQNNRTEALLDLSHTMAAPLFAVCRYPYEILPLLGEVLLSLPYFLCREGYRERGIGQYIHPTATVSPGAYLEGPVVIGPRSVVGEGARLAGGALLGEECRIGRDCRLCGGILFDGASVLDGARVESAVLGYRARIGAAVRTVPPGHRGEGRGHRAGACRWRCGVFLGDLSSVGEESLLFFGSILARGASVPPHSAVCGQVAATAAASAGEVGNM
ncbi:MAG: hypothetical protein J6T24_06755 [Clostridia bacterium]|nr:hypothetical protein [Clostridia bacterium]